MASHIAPGAATSEPAYRDFVALCPDGVWCAEWPRPISLGLAPEEQVALLIRGARITDANDAAASLLGRDRGCELIGRRLADVITDEPCLLNEVLLDFVTRAYRVTGRALPSPAADGAGRPLEHSLSGGVGRGALVRIWGVQRRGARRYPAPLAFHDLQKNAAVGQLAAGVAHDFNNLLTSILGYGEMVRDALEPRSRASGDLDQVLAAARRAESLTRQLLKFSRRSHRAAEVFDLNTAVQELQPLLRRLVSADIEIAVACAPEPALVIADRTHVELAILNLAMNARDAVRAGGSIAVATTVGAGASGTPVVRLTVSDDGGGMSREVLARIFEPFFTTRLGGTGLGLPTARALVARNGGRIDVASELGRGSAFTLTFDVADGDADIGSVLMDIRSRMDGSR